MSVSSEITAAQSYTAQTKAKEQKATGAAHEITATDFLNLMTEQLKYQDPLNPMDNSQFLSQQAQFSQLSTTQEMNKSLTQNNAIMQTLSLVGKEVTLLDPDKAGATITGKVSQANFSDQGASIMVNDKEYPIALIRSVRPTAQST